MSAVLIWSGVVVFAFAAIRLLLTRDRFARLHFVSLGPTLAAPLVIVGLTVAPWSSWHDVVKLVIIGGLLFVTGPATVITTGHAMRRTDDG
jgi:multisubunit Na+/H+ antiporter MnhG subunit